MASAIKNPLLGVHARLLTAIFVSKRTQHVAAGFYGLRDRYIVANGMGAAYRSTPAMTQGAHQVVMFIFNVVNDNQLGVTNGRVA